MQEISINKNDVGGYKYNAAVTLIKQINRALKHQLFEESADGMIGLSSKTQNNLTRYQSNVSIKSRFTHNLGNDAFIINNIINSRY